MYRKIFVLMMVIGVLAISAAAVYAQGGRGHGNGGSGRGGNGGVTGGACTDPSGCIPDPQAYNYGGQSSGGAQAGGSYGRQNQQGSRGMARNGSGIYNNLPPATVTELPAAIVDLMIDGWLDEQHAYAVYEAILTQYGDIAPFVNIQQAEAQHAAAWEFLMQRYGITVPAVPEFSVPQFASVEAACAAAADAEIANFALYDTMLAAFAPYPDLYQIAQALRDASEYQHLPAFQTCAG